MHTSRSTSTGKTGTSRTGPLRGLFAWRKAIGLSLVIIAVAVLFVYIGSLARAGVADRERAPAEWALYAVGLVATVAVVLTVTRMARRAVAKRTAPAG